VNGVKWFPAALSVIFLLFTEKKTATVCSLTDKANVITAEWSAHAPNAHVVVHSWQKFEKTMINECTAFAGMGI
jgi:putative cell wall-binding protein